MGQYNAAVAQFEQSFLDATYYSGLLSDELDGYRGDGDVATDRRLFSSSKIDYGLFPYTSLQTTRSFTVQAIGALAKYAPNASPALRGRMYAYKGYAEIFLADLFCSGVPLSELEFEGDFTYKPGSSTKNVYAHAIVLFDSAMALAGTNDSVVNLARVGKGRALLALDSAAAAAAVVASVPDNFLQQFSIEWVRNLNSTLPPTTFRYDLLASVSDRAGINGLPFRSSGDPRTAAYAYLYTNSPDNTSNLYAPAKYGVLVPDPVNPTNVLSSAPAVLASGIEARLIQAEAALKAGQVSTWLDILNALRTTGNPGSTTDVYSCPVDRDPNTGDCPVDSTFVRTDTLWESGTGGVAGLHELTDPGTPAARVDTMFAERAAWLFVDGHRQGDLRRLIRQYGRTQRQVYPTGTYIGPLSGLGAGVNAVYGDAVVLPIPSLEAKGNPLSRGCFDQDA